MSVGVCARTRVRGAVARASSVSMGGAQDHRAVTQASSVMSAANSHRAERESTCVCTRSPSPPPSSSYVCARGSHQLLLAPCLALLLVRLFKGVQLVEETALLHLLHPAVHVLALAQARVLGRNSKKSAT